MAAQEETLSSVDLFTKTSYLDSIEDVQRVVCTPTSIAHKFPGSIVFDIAPSNTMYTSLALELHVVMRILGADGQGYATANDVTFAAPIPGTLYSLFSDISVSFNGTTVVVHNQNFPVFNHVRTLICDTAFEKRQLNNELNAYYIDEPAKSSVIDTSNKSLTNRARYFNEGNRCHLMGQLKLDISDCGKLLLPGTRIRIRLQLNSNKHYLLSTAADKAPVYYIDECQMMAERYLLNAKHMLQIENQLSQGQQVIYNFNRHVLTLAGQIQNVTSYKFTLPLAQKPRYMLVFFQNADAGDGEYKSNPLHFPHKQVSSISVQFEARRYPGSHEQTLVRMDRSDQGDYFHGRHWFNTLVRICQQESKSVGQDIAFSLQQFDTDASLFAIKIDENSIANDVDTIKQSGNLGVRMAFKTQVAQLTNVYVWSVYKSNVMCSADRIYQLDYNPGSHQ